MQCPLILWVETLRLGLIKILCRRFLQRSQELNPSHLMPSVMPHTSDHTTAQLSSSPEHFLASPATSTEVTISTVPRDTHTQIILNIQPVPRGHSASWPHSPGSNHPGFPGAFCTGYEDYSACSLPRLHVNSSNTHLAQSSLMSMVGKSEQEGYFITLPQVSS